MAGVSASRFSSKVVLFRSLCQFRELTSQQKAGQRLSYLTQRRCCQQDSASSRPIAGEVVVEYQRGLPVVTVPLPSRREKCQFTLKPITSSVGDFLRDLQAEDHGIDRISVYTHDDKRVSSSTGLDVLLAGDFNLLINDVTYAVSPPEYGRLVHEDAQTLADVRALVHRLYTSLNVEQHQLEKERELLKRLEHLNMQLQPLERKKEELASRANQRTGALVWGGLALMGVQFGMLARLTWWEYSWDIMEPVTYFVTYGTSMAMYAYFVLTRKEYVFPDVKDRLWLRGFYSRARAECLDTDRYNGLRNEIARATSDLERLRDPLQLELPVQQLTREQVELKQKSSDEAQ